MNFSLQIRIFFLLRHPDFDGHFSGQSLKATIYPGCVVKCFCSVQYFLLLVFGVRTCYTTSMFVRTIKRSTTRNIAVQIVESYRNDHGQPRQRIVRHMGSVPAGRALDELRRLAQLELLKLHEDRQPTVFPARTLAEWAIEARLRRANETALPIADARQLSEEKRITLGFHEVFGALYEQLHLGQLWSSRYRVSEKVFREAVLMRLGNAVQQLLREPLEVVLMDVTTLSFASEVEDALRRKGYSKDGKPHRMQVVLALVQTKQGLPVGYRLFAGHVSEVKTLEPMIEQLRRQYKMQRVVVVADAAMASQENMAMMKARGLDWVVAARLRNMSQRNLEQIRHSQDERCCGCASSPILCAIMAH